VLYINYDDLLKNKGASGRYKDLLDIEQLKKTEKNNATRYNHFHNR
jgi:hypothetical protein